MCYLPRNATKFLRGGSYQKTFSTKVVALSEHETHRDRTQFPKCRCVTCREMLLNFQEVAAIKRPLAQKLWHFLSTKHIETELSFRSVHVLPVAKCYYV
ncbi:hypothetical protein AVEN_235029-1 [Araneus ventricosus]|uniref:Uncharacterized protein n=1 Tax=Araneus ventricosus TaxID=182803 RepID=A0A4Y2KYF0_ARAVE|nr:hypothetical protein AVEN_235029-1 [Araneus ventricosus]